MDKKCKGAAKMEKVFRQIKKRISFGWRTDIDFPAHIHEDIELIYVKKGGGVACCDGMKYTLAENSFFLAFPNQVHHYSECVEGEYIVLIIKPSDLLSYSNVFQEGIPESAMWYFAEQDNKEVPLLEMALDEFVLNGHSTILEAYLTAFFGKLLRHYTIEKCRETNDTVSHILRYCAEHYKENITVNDVAEALCISRSSISHIFSSRLAMNFCDYINSLRLLDAEKMLKSTRYSMTEISYMSGFGTIRTFNRAFAKRYGVSPSEYRNVFQC